MIAFRSLLVALFVGIIIFTIAAGTNHGWNLGKPFLEDIIAMNWSGQFNFDFLSYLWLSALWLAWRQQFSRSAIIMAALASVLGILFLAPYLMIASIQTKGDLKALLLGEKRAQSA